MRNTFYSSIVALLLFAVGVPKCSSATHLGVLIALTAGLVCFGVARDLFRRSDEKKGE